MSECASQDVKHLRLTFASLGAVHVGEQDVVVVCPVEPLVGVIDSESSGAIDPCVNDNRLPSAIHANTTNVRRFAAVCPEHVPESEVQQGFKELCTAAGKHYRNNKYKSESIPLLSQAVKAILESITVNSSDDNMLTLPGGPERDPWGF